MLYVDPTSVLLVIVLLVIQLAALECCHVCPISSLPDCCSPLYKRFCAPLVTVSISINCLVLRLKKWNTANSHDSEVLNCTLKCVRNSTLWVQHPQTSGLHSALVSGSVQILLWLEFSRRQLCRSRFSPQRADVNKQTCKNVGRVNEGVFLPLASLACVCLCVCVSPCQRLCAAHAVGGSVWWGWIGRSEMRFFPGLQLYIRLSLHPLALSTAVNIWTSAQLSSPASPFSCLSVPLRDWWSSPSLWLSVTSMGQKFFLTQTREH